jgi:hypothetical protein
MADELIAGKFKDDAALEQGVRELWKTTNGVEFPSNVKVIGEGGLAADQAAAIALYKTMESNHGKLRAPTVTPQAPKGDEKPLSLAPPPKAPVDIEDPAEAVKAAGIEWGDIEKAVTETGKPTAEHYEKLKAFGWNKSAVNAYIAGETARRQAGALSYNATVTSLGGKAALEQLIEQAKSHIPDSQIDAIDKMLKSADTLPVAVQALRGYAGMKPAVFVTGSGGGGGPASITTLKQYQETVLRAAKGDQAAKSQLESVAAGDVWRLK